MKLNYDFAVIGGDERQVYLAQLLCNRGYCVISYGLEEESLKLEYEGERAKTLEEALQIADIIVGPIPLSKDRKRISGISKKEDLTLENLKMMHGEKKQFFAGGIPIEFEEFAKENGIRTYDFMRNEELTWFNTIATAEGAIAEALIRHPGNLQGSACLVLGYGKCAATLARKLVGMSAKVTICARKAEARANAVASGYDAIAVEVLSNKIGGFEYIFNTIPSCILDRAPLQYVQKQALLIDLASSPGGIDFEAAKVESLSACSCLGLPGKYAPKASAKALIEVLLSNII